MFIVMQQGHTEGELADILEQLTQMGFSGHVSQGVERTVVG
ncbi:MAG: 3-deoxy-7-phosphoheptulonate synthase, partial [Dehalococcoidia bacterium]